LAEGFRFQNETGRIRVTRSRATVMFRHSQGTDPEPPCPKGVVDVPGKTLQGILLWMQLFSE
jgi:hypothetical protein